MTAVVLGLSAAALGIYSAKTGTGIMGRYVEVKQQTPSVVVVRSGGGGGGGLRFHCCRCSCCGGDILPGYMIIRTKYG